MKNLNHRAPRAKLVVLCLIAALATIGATASITVAANNAATAKKKAAFNKAQLTLVKKYAKKYAKTYAKAGPAGVNGAGPVYSATQTGTVDILSASYPGALLDVVSKAVPAGTYSVTATVHTSYTATTANAGASGRCRLFNGATEIDDSTNTANGPTVLFAGTVVAAEHPLQGVVTSTGGTTLTVKCQDNFDDGTSGEAFGASDGKIAAVQVTSAN